jgi:uncharacterized protein (TIGR02145 family)
MYIFNSFRFNPIGLGYGYLYNGYAIEHVNFPTSGWSVPSDTDFSTLVTYLIDNEYNYDGTTTGNKIAKSMASLTSWDTTTVVGAPGNTDYPTYRNKSGLSIKCVGRRSGGTFLGEGQNTILWSNTTHTSTKGYLWFDYQLVYTTAGTNSAYSAGASIRLIKDSTTLSDGETSTMTDYDGNVYDTICRGTQEWTVQNWKCTKLNNGTSLTKVTSDSTWAAASTGDYYYCAYDNDEGNV